MKRKLALIVVLLFVGLRPQLVACEEPRYPIKDSKIPVDRQTRPVWLNNNQIIFVGYAPDSANPPKQVGLAWEIPQAVYVWDLEKGKAVRDPSWDGTNSWCASGEFRSFHRLRSGTETTYELVEGKIGEERVQPLPVKWFNPISCRHYDIDLPYWRHEGKKTRSIPLLEEHGYLDFGLPSRADPSKASPVLLYPSDQKNPKQLPFTGEQVRFHVAYFEFAGVYLLEGHIKTTYATDIWLLKSDGTVVKALEPKGEQWEKLGWGQYNLTKKGLFAAGGSGPYDQVGTTGGYLFQRGKPARLIAGLTRNISVSPDGCKVAFVHSLHSLAEADSVKALREGKPGAETLKMIDFCAGKGE
ncbi:MAG: conserved exported protein of unknown function [Nitrospira sp.]|nr:MAG: conserved exported protein of unknown function [Nitrospira sp.]